ncbi:hypothetical protein C5E10_13645 [Pseudoclavibacter sp. RFBG4]|nr:hypothetical protein C5E10_13645 [Pseudoclavibacter sp. RFBG4]
MAIERFSQRGHHASSIKEIAEACGISRAGLLHRFTSEEELLLEVLEYRAQRDRQIFIRSGAAEVGGLGAPRHREPRRAQHDRPRPDAPVHPPCRRGCR